jgi:hypothetical protein
VNHARQIAPERLAELVLDLALDEARDGFDAVERAAHKVGGLVGEGFDKDAKIETRTAYDAGRASAERVIRFPAQVDQVESTCDPASSRLSPVSLSLALIAQSGRARRGRVRQGRQD